MEYCVYITTYVGSAMPGRYIGSSSVNRVRNGYRGSVRSKKWCSVWENEVKNHPEYFHTEILSVHQTRQDALAEELRLQVLMGVVKSTEWINEGYAQVKGYAGRNVQGSNNPMYGRGDAVREWCANNPEKLSERNQKAAHTQWSNPETRSNKISGMIGKSKTRKTLTQDQFVEMQRLKSQKRAQQQLLEIEYLGIVYLGWGELLEKTGVTKHLYKKYYLNGHDPLARKGANGPVKHTNLN